MDDDFALNARERYGYIYAKEKIFFDFTKFSRGIFSKDWTERGIFCGGCLAGMCGTLGCKGLGLGRMCLKKIDAVAVSSEKCCKFAGQLRAIIEGKRADFSERNSSSPKGGAYTRFINYSRQ